MTRRRLLFVGVTLAAATTAGAQTVTDRGIERGDPAAPVLVIEFADFGCSACAQFARESFQAIDQEFIETGRVRWQFVPFVLGPFRHSRQAAAAGVCASEQGAFWKLHDSLFEQQRRWSAPRHPEPALSALVAELGLDSTAFRRCLDRPEVTNRVRGFNLLAGASAVRATPTFFVNGQRVRGALPLATFREVLIAAENAVVRQ